MRRSPTLKAVVPVDAAFVAITVVGPRMTPAGTLNVAVLLVTAFATDSPMATAIAISKPCTRTSCNRHVRSSSDSAIDQLFLAGIRLEVIVE